MGIKFSIVQNGYDVCDISEATWFIVTEEGINAVYCYPYKSSDIAYRNMLKWNVGRIIYENDQEKSSAGASWAHKTIREAFKKWYENRKASANN
jgi:hypothetical protein